MRTRLLAVLTASATVLGVLALPWSAHAVTGNQIAPIAPTDSQAQILAKAATVTPSARQLAWQHEELTGFVHFGPNTYSGREVGLGTESPDTIQPTNLDTDEWARTFKDAGFKKVILVAKHHDGMLMFPSEYSKYGIASGTWLGGKGDIVKSFTDSAHAAGIKVGIYLSPADLHENLPGGRFGNGSKPISATIPSSGTGNGTTFQVTADDYNRYYMNTLYELLTRYGTIDEVWFDGYDPTGGRQHYNFHDWYRIVRTLQPSAAIFGGDARWVGNEDGNARTSEWSVIPNTGTGTVDDPRSPTFGEQPDDIAQDDKLTTASSYLSWYPAECDARMEPTWFWHPNQAPKSLDALTSMYFNSVGRNCQLLLDMTPDTSGRFPAADVTRLAEFGAKIRSMFATDLASGAVASSDSGGDPSKVLDGDDSTGWQPTGTTGSLVLDLGRPRNLRTILLQENIRVGQRVKSFAVDTWTRSAWQQAATGTTIGYKRLLQLATPVNTQKVRLRVLDSRALPPMIATVGLYDDGSPVNIAVGKPATQSSTHSNGEAYRAVDGNTNGSFPAGSVTHTSDTFVEQSPWWQVDLGGSSPIGDLAVWNRTDCCGNRLSNYWIFVSDTPFDTKLTPAQQATRPGVWSNHQTTQAGSPTTLTVGRAGRYVMVQLNGTGPLSLAEVQVFSAAPATHYVDCAAGNDSNSGSSATTPWKTLAKVSSTTFSAGDSILLKRGTTCAGTLAPQGSGTSGNPITVDAYGTGAKPIIAGGGASRAVLLHNQQQWEIRNLEITNKGAAVGNRRGVSVELSDYGTASHIVLANLDVHDVNGDDTKDTGGSGGIYFSITGTATQTRFADVVIRDNTVRSVDREGIFMVSTWNRSGFETHSAGVFLPWAGVVVSGNQLSDLGGDGIVAGNTTGALIEHNSVDGFQKRSSGYNAGMWTYDSDNAVFQYNEATGGGSTRDGMAYDVDQGTDGTVFQYNHSHDNTGGFLLLCNASGILRNAVVRYNVSQNDSYRGVENCSGTIESAQVYNNTVLIGPGISQSVVQENNTTRRNVVFRNNIVVKTGGGSASMTLRGGGYVVDHNDLVAVSGAPFGAGITSDPKLSGYRLCSGSPALGAGILVSGNGGKDYFGNTVSATAAPNIGAYGAAGVNCGTS